jgi:DNA-binding HxlR family transcriptional regulator
LLIMRDALFGARRFDEFKTTGIADNVLTARLKRLVDAGILERRQYQIRPNRFEYVLTDKGRALAAVVAALRYWGTEWTTGEDQSPRLMHTACGHDAAVGFACADCGRTVAMQEIQITPARGAAAEADRPRRPSGPPTFTTEVTFRKSASASISRIGIADLRSDQRCERADDGDVSAGDHRRVGLGKESLLEHNHLIGGE